MAGAPLAVGFTGWAEQRSKPAAVVHSMDLSLSLVAREPSQGLSPSLNGLPRAPPPKTAKKPKKAVLFFEVEILDAKTREKLCFLDKVGPCRWRQEARKHVPPAFGAHPCPSEGTVGVLALGEGVGSMAWQAWVGHRAASAGSAGLGKEVGRPCQGLPSPTRQWGVASWLVTWDPRASAVPTLAGPMRLPAPSPGSWVWALEPPPWPTHQVEPQATIAEIKNLFTKTRESACHAHPIPANPPPP